MLRKLVSFFSRVFKLSRPNLLQKVVDKDRAAFSRLVYEYHDHLIDFATHYIKYQKLAEEIVENAFKTLSGNLQDIDINVAPLDYLHKITCELIFDYLSNAYSDINLKKEIWKSLLQTSIQIEDEKIRSEMLYFTSHSIGNSLLQKELIQKKSNSIPSRAK